MPGVSQLATHQFFAHLLQYLLVYWNGDLKVICFCSFMLNTCGGQVELGWLWKLINCWCTSKSVSFIAFLFVFIETLYWKKLSVKQADLTLLDFPPRIIEHASGFNSNGLSQGLKQNSCTMCYTHSLCCDNVHLLSIKHLQRWIILLMVMF